MEILAILGIFLLLGFLYMGGGLLGWLMRGVHHLYVLTTTAAAEGS